MMPCHCSSRSLLCSTTHWENGSAKQCVAIHLANQSWNHTKNQLQALFQMQSLEAVRNGRDKKVNGNQNLEGD